MTINNQAIGTHGVMLQSPPKGELFAAFHGTMHLATSTPEMTAPTNAMPGYLSSMPMWGSMPWMMPGIGSAYPALFNSNPASSYPGALLSSDPPDDGDANPYLDITDFLKNLDLQHPRRNLTWYALQFESMDFYNIDEIAKLLVERLSGDEFGLTAGNAQFLWNEVNTEMKRVD